MADKILRPKSISVFFCIYYYLIFVISNTLELDHFLDRLACTFMCSFTKTWNRFLTLILACRHLVNDLLSSVRLCTYLLKNFFINTWQCRKMSMAVIFMTNNWWLTFNCIQISPQYIKYILTPLILQLTLKISLKIWVLNGGHTMAAPAFLNGEAKEGQYILRAKSIWLPIMHFHNTWHISNSFPSSLSFCLFLIASSTTFSFPSPTFIQLSGLGSAVSSPAGPGGAWPPNAIFVNSGPKNERFL